MIQIMDGDIIVAEQIDPKNPSSSFRRTGNGMTPPGLFKKGEDVAWVTDYIKWINSRVFPAERIGADELLEQMGLDRYDKAKILKLTKARQFADNYWVRMV